MRVFAYTQLETLIVQSQKLKGPSVQVNLNAYKQVMERERKHYESENAAKARQIEEAVSRTKKINSENESLKQRVAELEQEIVEREACEAQVQEYVK